MIFSFVDQLISQFADRGCECHVITPVAVFDKDKTNVSRVKTTQKGNKVYIHCPHYTPVPHRVIFGYDTYRITFRHFFAAVRRAYRKHVGKADVIYSHFLNPAGIAAAKLSKTTGVPAFVACGESSLDSAMFAVDLYRRDLAENISGVIAVSGEIKRILEEKNIFPHTPIRVFPNGIDFSEFPEISRKDARAALGFPTEDFLVAFVGYFIERKGIGELLAAAQKDRTWSCMFIGRGELPAPYEKSVFVGSVPHPKLHLYLHAADVFVLPTKAEGCCNAILEAMACGLPIVSSDLPFNDEILEDNYSIRVSPTDVDAVYQAVTKLKTDTVLRDSMAKASFARAKEFDIANRAANILAFMQQCIRSDTAQK